MLYAQYALGVSESVRGSAEKNDGLTSVAFPREQEGRGVSLR